MAETFSLLAALFPGRIDLGLGRAAGTDPLTTFALQRDRRQAAPDDFPQQLAELLAYFDDSLPDRPSVRAAGQRRSPAAPSCRTPWLLGSSAQSAIWAGRARPALRVRRLHQPEGAEIAELYRERFEPEPRPAGSEHRRRRVGARRADTEEEASHLATSSRMTFTLLRRGQLIAVPPPEKAVEFLKREGKPLNGAPARPARDRRHAREGAGRGRGGGAPSTAPRR